MKHYIFLTLLVPFMLWGADGMAKDVQFNANFDIAYGNDHVFFLDQGTEVHLSMDINSGAGFRSKLSYGSGFFHMRIKLPAKDSAGVVTAFYLSSQGNNHDELDFEFLGNREGKPITLQTNVYANGQGNREQRTHLWFDPTADFHDYRILWNEHQIVFFVDNIPIRVFKNHQDKGVSYPSQPMQIIATLWDGDSWATDGGKEKIDWSRAPFVASFQSFNVNGCRFGQDCSSSRHRYNQRRFWNLNNNQQKAYDVVRQKYMTYDYCADRPRYPQPPPECLV